MAYSGTLCVNGECYGIVVRSGDYTALGQVANLANEEHQNASPLSVEVAIQTPAHAFFFILKNFENSNLFFFSFSLLYKMTL